MNICLIGPGFKPIPPIGWGAVESVIWDYYINLKKRGYPVKIINNNDLQTVVEEINANTYTHVHIMYDDYIVIVPYLKNNIKIFYTSHYAYITQDNFKNTQISYFNNIFMKVIQNQNRIIINALSEEIKKIYIEYGFDKKNINIIHNGARDDEFCYYQLPKYKHKSIYLAKIENRKKQYKYQQINNIDFVGNYHNSTFDVNNKNYLGEWNKEILYSELSNYGNLILLSDGEADPLVVKEALLCGLGVVISECSSANLDKHMDFITIIPNNKLDDINFISKEIIKNRLFSINNRENIRKYAMEKFSWKSVIDKYVLVLQI